MKSTGLAALLAFLLTAHLGCAADREGCGGCEPDHVCFKAPEQCPGAAEEARCVLACRSNADCAQGKRCRTVAACPGTERTCTPTCD